MLQISHFVFNPFQENTYILWDETSDCVIIDPGCSSEEERNELLRFIQSNNLNPVMLLNTHCHIDHILGNRFVSNTFGLKLLIHEGELFTYKDADRWAAMFGLKDFEMPEDIGFIQEGETLRFGNSTLEVLFTPGHSIASVSFYHAPENILISGDVLFYHSIGRTDLPGGNSVILENSIRQTLYTLPNQTKVYSGHGNPTTIEHEKRFNPMVNEIGTFQS